MGAQTNVGIDSSSVHQNLRRNISARVTGALVVTGVHFAIHVLATRGMISGRLSGMHRVGTPGGQHSLRFMRRIACDPFTADDSPEA